MILQQDHIIEDEDTPDGGIIVDTYVLKLISKERLAKK